MNRKALHKISYGLYIVTAENNSTPGGCIINTVFQITSEPPRIAIGLNRENHTHSIISQSKSFAVNVLPEETPAQLIQTFGYKTSREWDKFQGLTPQKGEATGAPLLLNETMAWLECKTVESVDVGTHTIFIAEVVNSDITQPGASEMTYKYYHEVLKGITPPKAPGYTPPEKNSTDTWVCPVCGYTYDPQIGDSSHGIEPGTPWQDLPSDWVCPLCATAKEYFIQNRDD